MLEREGFVSWVSEEFLEESKDRERPAEERFYQYVANDEILKVAGLVLKMSADESEKSAEKREKRGQIYFSTKSVGANLYF